MYTLFELLVRYNPISEGLSTVVEATNPILTTPFEGLTPNVYFVEDSQEIVCVWKTKNNFLQLDLADDGFYFRQSHPAIEKQGDLVDIPLQELKSCIAELG